MKEQRYMNACECLPNKARLDIKLATTILYKTLHHKTKLRSLSGTFVLPIHSLQVQQIFLLFRDKVLQCLECRFQGTCLMLDQKILELE